MTILENGAYLARLKNVPRANTPIRFLRQRLGGGERPGKGHSTLRTAPGRALAGGKSRSGAPVREMLAGANWAAFLLDRRRGRAGRIGPDRAAPAGRRSRRCAPGPCSGTSMIWTWPEAVCRGRRGDLFLVREARVIRGFEALLGHHRGFGSSPAGKTPTPGSGSGTSTSNPARRTASAAADLVFFDRDVGGIGPLQRGPPSPYS